MSHYDAPDLIARVTALLPDGRLSARDLAPLDQFHVGGLKATEHLAALAGIEPGMRVLDVGCGVGGPSRFLAAQGCVVTGLDLSADYVVLSRLLAERAGLNVDYVCADALDMPFEDASFDLIWTQHATMNIADKPRLYGEMARLLKPGGRLAFHDVCAGDGELLLPVPWARRREHSVLMSPEALRSLLEDLGFKVESWRDASAEAVAFLERAPAVPPPLSLALLLGDELPAMLSAYLANLRQNRAKVVDSISQRH
ncbi:MAG TPA: class I SAM-dependent methyltransferase [Candidatus Sulfotelmatobacter sp.]|jgi:SAM-dependent methyltransferase|nr:class I SAM-dependent methyltransferase [Candidatus Sulfotelmatobacter sp.]